MTATIKAYKGLPMEGAIATWYAKLTFKDIKRHQLMAEQLARKIPAGGSVLEIAPGPGYFCIELAKLGNYQIAGLDISKSFVDIARRNAAEANLKINFQEGNASAMPFVDGSFDFTFCQAAFKNFSQPVKAIEEMYRVLRPGGVAVIADLRRDASQTDINEEIMGMQLNRIDQLMTGLIFRNILLKSAYSIGEINEMVSQTSFGKCKIDASGIGFQVWLQK